MGKFSSSFYYFLNKKRSDGIDTSNMHIIKCEKITRVARVLGKIKRSWFGTYQPLHQYHNKKGSQKIWFVSNTLMLDGSDNKEEILQAVKTLRCVSADTVLFWKNKINLLDHELMWVTPYPHERKGIQRINDEIKYRSSDKKPCVPVYSDV